MTADPLPNVDPLVAAVAGPDPPTLLDVRWRLADPSAGLAEFTDPDRPIATGN